MLTTGPFLGEDPGGPPGRGGARTRPRRSFRSSLVAPRRQVDVLEYERLLMTPGLAAETGELPDGHVREALVVAPGFAVRRGVLDAVVPASRLVSTQRIAAHQLGELE